MNHPSTRGAARLCVISDIHGNLPALLAVLDAAGRLGADAVMVGGDLVAHGPHPAETLDALRSIPGCRMIRGNTDRYLVDPATTPRWSTQAEERRASLAWTREELGPERLELLAELPAEITVDSCLLVHASPGSDERGIFPATPVERFDSDDWTSLLLCGHTHVPVVRDVAGRRVVNAGSVAWTLDGDPRPSFAMLERRSEGAPWEVELHRVNYPRERTLADLEARRVPWRQAVRTFITTASPNVRPTLP